MYFLIGGIAGIVAVVLITAWILLRRRKSRRNLPPEKAALDYSLSVAEEYACPKISNEDILLATDNLSTSNYIGQGIAGKVYRGTLSTGEHVAVKHIVNDGQLETFMREVKSVSHIRHPNLVTLLGYSNFVDNNKEECFLVYELCHNGNLYQWLYSKSKEGLVLSWIQRLEIAIDSARGLWFLHTYPQGCIVHRDIKPQNILIDASFQAKLSDFGLSKVMDMDQSHVVSEVRGTFGYVDPEYRNDSRVYASADVYSFGMVLLQLLSARRVIDMNSNRPMNLSQMARFLTRQGNLSEFADPKLQGEYSLEAFDLVFKLALSCTGIKEQRPSMEQVVQKLERAHQISYF
ncbi:probable receptor-like protein kinase At5g18500 [Rutidosis leptorrhynchoides]|uniref:probable receptor-like protein kinase At5g18500 n=1 Tax=Rutidosis leptorrhynchoides TaxID=125765 RepID=UPI003A990A3C